MEEDIAKEVNEVKWKLDEVYQGYNSPEFKQDLTRVKELYESLEEPNRELESALLCEEFEESVNLLTTLRKCSLISKEIYPLLGNLSVYTICRLSIDSQDEDAQKMEAQLQDLSSKISIRTQQNSLILDRVSDEFLQTYLEEDAHEDERFAIEQSRKMKDFLLDSKEESLLKSLSIPGKKSWSELYSKLTGSFKIDFKGETIGYAKALGLLEDALEENRKAALLGIEKAIDQQKLSFAQILISQVKFRTLENERRSHNRPCHFLSGPLNSSCLEKTSLESMNETVANFREQAWKILELMAKSRGKEKLDPWDLQAPAPVNGPSRKIAFHQGIKIVESAYSKVHPEMGEFISKMVENHWVDVSRSPTRRPSAYAISFPKTGEPRLFGTYMGTMMSLRVMAHEMGHCFHSWVMRDLSPLLRSYPMTLAETASIFGELLLAQEILDNPDYQELRALAAWQEAQNIITYLINIPLRFEFEEKLYQKFEEGYNPTVKDLDQWMNECFQTWYGPWLSQPLSTFWASKLHFNLACFYNYPYTFGYLFSHGLFANYLELRGDFYSRYVQMLRLTGSRTCEDIVESNLQLKLEDGSFWSMAIKEVEKKIPRIQKTLGENFLNS